LSCSAVSIATLEALNSAFHQQRQNAIDEELFDVISGFEALEYERKTGEAMIVRQGQVRPWPEARR